MIEIDEHLPRLPLVDQEDPGVEGASESGRRVARLGCLQLPPGLVGGRRRDRRSHHGHRAVFEHPARRHAGFVTDEHREPGIRIRSRSGDPGSRQRRRIDPERMAVDLPQHHGHIYEDLIEDPAIRTVREDVRAPSSAEHGPTAGARCPEYRHDLLECLALGEGHSCSLQRTVHVVGVAVDEPG